MPASYRTAKHGVKSVEDLVKQIQPYLGDKKDAVLKVLAGSTDTYGTSSSVPAEPGGFLMQNPSCPFRYLCIRSLFVSEIELTR
jgi:hypothetical protein